jgi:hypothetical protein
MTTTTISPTKSRIQSRLRRRAASRVRSLEPTVHFHVDGGGRAYVCDLGRCESAALTQDEASDTQASLRRWEHR